MNNSRRGRQTAKAEQPKRPPPFFVLTGLVVGLLAGLVLAWLVFPARVEVIGPGDLPADLREDYRVTVALAFASSGDLARARARLDLLGSFDVVRQLNSQAQLALLNQESQREARALGQLAEALAAAEPVSEAPVDAVAIPPEQVSGADYEVSEQQLICAEEGFPLLKLFVMDNEGIQRAGLELRLSSEEDTQEGFTGFKPELGPGYAEFVLTPGVDYRLRVQDGDVLSGIRAAGCEDGGWGSWLITLRSK